MFKEFFVIVIGHYSVNYILNIFNNRTPPKHPAAQLARGDPETGAANDF